MASVHPLPCHPSPAGQLAQSLALPLQTSVPTTLGSVCSFPSNPSASGSAPSSARASLDHVGKGLEWASVWSAVCPLLQPHASDWSALNCGSASVWGPGRSISEPSPPEDGSVLPPGQESEAPGAPLPLCSKPPAHLCLCQLPGCASHDGDLGSQPLGEAPR